MFDGTIIRRRRKDKNLTLQNIADTLQVSVGRVSEWERSLGEPSPDNRRKICELLDITDAELYGAPRVIFSQEVLNALDDPIAVKALSQKEKVV